jgi:hypothetical protein
LTAKSKYSIGFCSFSGLKMKRIRFFAFSPKASKSRFKQAGLLTHPLFNPFPPLPIAIGTDSGALLKVIQDLQQRELYRNHPF